MPAERLPVALVGILPTAKPFQAVGDVPDFITVNAVQQTRRLAVAHRLKSASEVTAEVEVRLLEGQTQPGEIIQRTLHRGHGAPEITTDGNLAELNPALLHALQVETGVKLLLLERLPNTTAKGGGRIREAQEG